MQKKQASKIVSELLELAAEVSGTDPGSETFQMWEFRLHRDIKRIFGPNSEFAAMLSDICFEPWYVDADYEWGRKNQLSINAAVALLKEAKREVESWPEGGLPDDQLTSHTRPESQLEILARLRNLDEALEQGYRQVLEDGESTHRVSYKGTANELREVLRGVLNKLAPKELVEKTDWHKKSRGQAKTKEERERGPTRVTQVEQVRYILKERNKGSKEVSSAEETMERVEEILGRLTRAVYGRASDASHRSKDRSEIIAALRYLDALLLELLPPQTSM